MIPRLEVANRMNLFPEVLWDRYAETEQSGCAFGWISRNTISDDFLVLQWWQEPDENGAYAFWSITSSPRYSAEFAERLSGPDSGHTNCQRVEDGFSGMVAKVVHLVTAA